MWYFCFHSTSNNLSYLDLYLIHSFSVMLGFFLALSHHIGEWGFYFYSAFPSLCILKFWQSESSFTYVTFTLFCQSLMNLSSDLILLLIKYLPNLWFQHHWRDFNLLWHSSIRLLWIYFLGSQVGFATITYRICLVTTESGAKMCKEKA